MDKLPSISQLGLAVPAAAGTATAKPPKFEPIVPGLLEQFLQTVPEAEPSGLSLDVWEKVLGWVGYLHVVSLEECARSCRSLYVMSRQDSIWRKLIHSARARRGHRLPQDVLSAYPSPRQVFFAMPRLRTDGVYICKISYVRPGLTDGAFFQPVHMVTYYRYLRLLGPEYGHLAILLVTTMEPQQTIPLLRAPLEGRLYLPIPFGAHAVDLVRAKALKGQRHWLPTAKLPEFKKANLFLGRYFRDARDARRFHLTLYDPQSAHNALFAMEVGIPESRQNSNVLVCHKYSSVTPPSIVRDHDNNDGGGGGGETRGGMPDGSTIPLPSVYDFETSDWGRFIFSRVRSYHT